MLKSGILCSSALLKHTATRKRKNDNTTKKHNKTKRTQLDATERKRNDRSDTIEIHKTKSSMQWVNKE